MNGAGVWRSLLTELVVEWVSGSKQTQGLTQGMLPCSVRLSPPTHRCSHLPAAGGANYMSRDQTLIFHWRGQRWDNRDTGVNSSNINVVFPSRCGRADTGDIADVFLWKKLLICPVKVFCQLSDIHSRLPHIHTQKIRTLKCSSLPQGSRGGGRGWGGCCWGAPRQ